MSISIIIEARLIEQFRNKTFCDRFVNAGPTVRSVIDQLTASVLTLSNRQRMYLTGKSSSLK